MNRAERRKQKKQKPKTTYHKSELGGLVDKSFHLGVKKAIDEYSVAILYTIRKELKFGRKRGQRISNAIMSNYDKILSGELKTEEMRAVVENEMGIHFK